MPFKSSGIIRKCKWCDKPVKKYYIGTRFKGYRATCGSEECLKKAYHDKNIKQKKRFNQLRKCEICGNEYVASCSFGKDSLAMLIKIKELGLPLDEVIYCEIMFDDNISGETPEMYQFTKKAEKILKEKFDIKVTHLRGVTFKEQFYRVKKKGKHIGDNYGFPYVIGSWCNSRLKIEPIRKYFKSNKDVIQYVGIAYDEPERYNRLNHETHICPLYDLKITEKEAMEICKKYDLVSPIYKTSFRGGYWFCPKQSIKQLKWLYRNHRDLWNMLKEMEKDSFNTFRPNQTLKQLEERFKEEQMTIYDYIEE